MTSLRRPLQQFYDAAASGRLTRKAAVGVIDVVAQKAMRGDGEALYVLAWLSSVVNPGQDKRRRRLVLAAAERGYPHAELVHGAALASRGDRRGLWWVQRAAASGSPDALTWLGQVYLHGAFVPLSLTRAERLFRQAAKLGSADAAHWLGLKRDFFDKGNAWLEAARWYRKAAEGGVADAAFNLAVCYERGLGVRRDAKLMRHWRRRAATLQRQRDALKWIERPSAARAERGRFDQR